MSQYRLSQLAPLPHIKELEIGKTIGQGGFGVVKSAIWKHDGTSRVFALKFVNIQMALQHQVTVEMLAREALIQKECRHKNVISLYDFGADSNWVWMVMEMGSNGELFDKIEPDRGVDEEVAHFYFSQLINAVDFVHSKGVAHRDIKPENLVLDSAGNLKLTDFGLANVFRKKTGPKRICTTPCGSPPYVAPELILRRYDPELADIWSCGIVLFVLLTGKIAWEMPYSDDPDYDYFVKNKGEILVSPWNKLPIGALSLLRKILTPNPSERITLEGIRQQPWFAKKDCFMNSNGLCKDTLHLTTRLLVSLYINLSDEEYHKVNDTATQVSSGSKDIPDTQPAPYLVDDIAPGSSKENDYQPMKGFSSSQIVYTEHTKRKKLDHQGDDTVFSIIAQDPASLQFIGKDRTQAINDNISVLGQSMFALSLTRFFSFAPVKQILLTILESLYKLGYRSIRDYEDNESYVESLSKDDELDGLVTIPINGRDSANMQISGNIKVTRLAENTDARKIEFIKSKSDPLEWRRFFRRVTILCRDVVYVNRTG
ncbi:DEKNAAC101763 [Brettanomyces naardenensis]|uniref:non-specific serine/threonine protein kinase n=1 Tax=Brettanomyces naardenensis TaxID=13370 RepID=A0A448YIR7_BRENA|nr:DEKNAAC101763 [Brettanomyces naardenensis]